MLRGQQAGGSGQPTTSSGQADSEKGAGGSFLIAHFSLRIYHYTSEMIFMASLHLNPQSTIRNRNCIDYEDLKENH
jgi:hypothetical protein